MRKYRRLIVVGIVYLVVRWRRNRVRAADATPA